MPVSQAGGPVRSRTLLFAPQRLLGGAEFCRAAGGPRSFLLPADTGTVPPPHFTPSTRPRFILPVLKAFRDPTPAEGSLCPFSESQGHYRQLISHQSPCWSAGLPRPTASRPTAAPIQPEQPSWAACSLQGQIHAISFLHP